MATPGDLVRHMARVLGLAEPSILIYDRQLAEAGFRSRRGRGTSAPVVTARDAALLLTAVLASPQVKEAASTIERYLTSRALPAASPFAGTGIAELEQLPKGHSFVDAIEGLFLAGARDAFSAMEAIELQVAAISPGTRGEIRLAGSSASPVLVRYLGPSSFPGDEHASHTTEPEARRGDLDQIRRVSQRTFSAISSLLRREETA